MTALGAIDPPVRVAGSWSKPNDRYLRHDVLTRKEVGIVRQNAHGERRWDWIAHLDDETRMNGDAPTFARAADAVDHFLGKEGWYVVPSDLSAGVGGDSEFVIKDLVANPDDELNEMLEEISKVSGNAYQNPDDEEMPDL